VDLIECRRYHARLTQQACLDYRASHPDACVGCEGGTKSLTAVKKREGDLGAKKETKCLKCGEIKPNHRRGRCVNCYQKARRAGEFTPRPRRLDKPGHKDEPLNRPRRLAGLDVHLVFTPKDADLFGRLKALAERERRSLEQQVFWFLDRQLPAEMQQ
jgi:hypothetical protein